VCVAWRLDQRRHRLGRRRSSGLALSKGGKRCGMWQVQQGCRHGTICRCPTSTHMVHACRRASAAPSTHLLSAAQGIEVHAEVCDAWACSR
jgi:hypothetical protein